MLSIKERLLRYSLISCLVFNSATHLFAFEIIEDTPNKFDSSLITFDMIDTPPPITFDKIEESDLFALDIYGQATFVPQLDEEEPQYIPQYIHVTDYTVIQWNDTLISAKELQAFIEAGAFTSATPLSAIHEFPENTQLVVLDDNPHFQSASSEPTFKGLFLIENDMISSNNETVYNSIECYQSMNQTILCKYFGEPLSDLNIIEIMDAIEYYYRDAYSVIVTADLPDQDLSNGILKVAINKVPAVVHSLDEVESTPPESLPNLKILDNDLSTLAANIFNEVHIEVNKNPLTFERIEAIKNGLTHYYEDVENTQIKITIPIQDFTSGLIKLHVNKHVVPSDAAVDLPLSLQESLAKIFDETEIPAELPAIAQETFINPDFDLRVPFLFAHKLETSHITPTCYEDSEQKKLDAVPIAIEEETIIEEPLVIVEEPQVIEDENIEVIHEALGSFEIPLEIEEPQIAQVKEPQIEEEVIEKPTRKAYLAHQEKAEPSESRRASHFNYFDSEKDESTSEKLTRQMKQLAYHLPEKKSPLSIQEEDDLDQFMRLLSDQEAYSFPEHHYVEEMEVVIEEKEVVVDENKTEVIVEAPQVEMPVLATQEKPQFFPHLKGMLVEEKEEITSKIGTFYHFIEQSLDLSLIDAIKSAMLEHFQEKYGMKVKVTLPQQDLNAGIIHLHIEHAS